jgi:hypothetical protein
VVLPEPEQPAMPMMIGCAGRVSCSGRGTRLVYWLENEKQIPFGNDNKKDNDNKKN